MSVGKRVSLALLCALPLGGLALGGVAVVSASAGPADATIPIPACAVTASCTYHVVTPPNLQVLTGPGNNELVAIDYDLYIPDVATNETPQPAVIYFNGFGGKKDDDSGLGISKYLARHGYVVVPFSSQGFGNSTGKIGLDSPDYDVKDDIALIDAIAKLPYVYLDGPYNPRLGTTGGSYGGAIQELLAETDSRVKVISPWRTWNSLEYALAPNNQGPTHEPQSLPCCGVGKLQWTSLFFAKGASEALNGHNSSGAPIDLTTPADTACPGFPLTLCLVYFKFVTTGVADQSTRDILQFSSPQTHIDRLNVPTLLGQGESDTLFNLNDAAATYESLRARGIPTRMIWHSNGHGYDDLPGEGDVFGGATAHMDTDYLPPQILAWFDHYLRKTTTPTGPGFSYFRDWVPYSGRDYRAAVGNAPHYPAQSLITFSLSGSSDLAPPGTAPVPGSVTFVNPPGGQPASYTETSNFQSPTSTISGTSQPSPFRDLPPTDPPCAGGVCQYADFTSTPFTRDVVSVGVPRAHLHLSSAINPTDIVFYGKVYDVAPDRSTVLIKRLIAPVRVFDSSQAVDVQLLGFAHQFSKGHRVRLTIAATDQTSANNRVPDQVTLIQPGLAPVAMGPLQQLLALFVQPAQAAPDYSTFSLPIDNASAPVPVVAPPTPSPPPAPGASPVAGPTTPGSTTPVNPNTSAGIQPAGWLGLAAIILGSVLLATALRRRRRA